MVAFVLLLLIEFFLPFLPGELRGQLLDYYGRALDALLSGLILFGAMLLVWYLTTRREDIRYRELELFELEKEARKPFVEGLIHLIKIEDCLTVYLSRIDRQEESADLYEMLRFSYPEEDHTRLHHFDAMVQRYFGVQLDERLKPVLGELMQNIRNRRNNSLEWLKVQWDAERGHSQTGPLEKGHFQDPELRFLPISIVALFDVGKCAYNESRGSSKSKEWRGQFEKALKIYCRFVDNIKAQIKSKGTAQVYCEVVERIQESDS